jgi:dTDP-4-dehydrorhamnose 3,5-epimerase
MRFEDLSLSGAKLIHGAPAVDNRGYFERILSAAALKDAGIETSFPEISLSENDVKATRRGMHFQRAPHEEAKIVRCVRGALFDVIVDIRRDSPTFGRSYSTTLEADDHRGLYVPRGFAHGFQTLEAHTTVLYLISEPYVQGFAAGLSADDPILAIDWPEPPACMSDRDRRLPPLASLIV